ncbi:hypothetical protein VTN77DRAFT_1181 [Rasamsonia byssochlamydoides]|uniref:uncharacterized protein n=1 Tax=Rasamsonia byssochlamydoides TaxID=89139 RepID=UPI00374283DA
MDIPRLSSTPSIHVHDCNNSYDRHSSFSSRGPMRIPTKTVEDFAPPPLPPPPRINALEDGHDVGWLHANAMGAPDVGKLAPINPSSSLYGGHRRPEPIPRLEKITLGDLDGRGKSSLLGQGPQTQIKIEPPGPVEEGFRNSISTSLSEPILQGERDFSRKSVKNSSDNYDRHLLSKIGKPHSPPRSSAISSLPFHSRSFGSGFQSSPIFDGTPSAPDSRSSIFQSGAISPGTKTGWKDYTDYRSPSVESSAPSSGVDFDAGRRQAGAMTPQHEDTFSLSSRSNRGSYDQGIFSDVEGEFSVDEGGQFRQPPSYLDSMSIHSKQHGMKRRASSPPRELSSDDRHPLHKATSSGDLAQRRTSGHPFTGTVSPSSRYPPSHGSLSSTSSASFRSSASYSSSVSLSLGGSSITSVSSYDRLSSGGLSPKSEQEQFHDKSNLNQPSPSGSLAGLPAARGPQYPSPTDPKSALSTRKMSVQSALNVAKPSGPKIGGMYICECCPKKPKKFDTPEELRAHESEKQYSCQFCNNRFKNKNEAERHQNSLHLRRHSWSCAALPSYQAAFHPSTSPSCQTSAGPSHDTCGYCGEEFPNFPQADWDRRFEHLTTVHKFGECNNVKKFYRADHFRQHLKHSHAGTSGKWTNILENACMKEEPQSEARLGSISEQGSRRPDHTNGGGAGSTAGTLTSNTIDEVMDES